MIIIPLIITLFLAIFLVGLLAASETSLFSLSSLQVKAFKEDKEKKKRLVGDLLSKPRDLLVTILMVNIAMSILVQNIVASIFGDYEAWWLNVLVPLALTLILGEVIPKSIALTHNVAIATKMAPFILAIQWLLNPIRKVLIAITQPISRFFFFFLRAEAQISIDELKHALKASEQYEILGKGESRLIYGYLELEEYSIKELMTPRTSMITYSIKEPIENLKALIKNEKLSRIPIYDQNLDQILGVLKIENLFSLADEPTQPMQLLPLLKKPFFVPETLPAKVLFNQLTQMKQSMAIAVDEYGAVSGLITKEDLIERLIGETDHERGQLFTKVANDVVIASSQMELAEFNEYFLSDLESESNMATIGGWLIEKLSEIPKSGTKVNLEGFFFHVLSATPKKIKTLYVRKLQEKKSP